MNTTVVYVFGVLQGDAASDQCDDLPRFPSGTAPRTLDAAGLRALVCDVDPDVLTRLTDPEADTFELLAQVATAHDGILVAVAGWGPVLPLRMGTVVDDDAAVETLLHRHGDVLREQLDRVAGCGEWAVVLRASPAMADEPDSDTTTDTTRDGRSYLERRRAELSERERDRRAVHELVDRVHGRLSMHAVDATVVPAGRNDATPALLHGVYLLDDDDVEPFRDELAALQRKLTDVLIELNGPLPAYHFVAPLEDPAAL